MSYAPVTISQEEIDREIDQLLEDEQDENTIEMSEEIVDLEAQPQSTQYTLNDGVFSNMSAKPALGNNKVFEEIEPPTYHEAVVDPAPDYFVNCVDENTGEVLIEGIFTTLTPRIPSW